MKHFISLQKNQQGHQEPKNVELMWNQGKSHIDECGIHVIY
jgi:hypothetical protein